MIVSEYAVLSRKPLRGRTVIASRRHCTRAAPSDGDSTTTLLRSPPRDRSLITSLNRTVTLRSFTFRAPESGVTFTMTGACLSTGPPGGAPGEAHDIAPAAAATSITATRVRVLTGRPSPES